MALELKQSMRLSQQLVITPQLQQAIKLLQMTKMELQEVVQTEMNENPLLEEQEIDASAETEPQEINEREADHETAASAETEAASDGESYAANDTGIEEVGNSTTGELQEPQNFDWENYLDIYNSPWPASQPPPQTDGPTFENSVRLTETLQEHLLWQLSMSGWSHDEVTVAEEIVGNLNDDGYLLASVEEMATSLNMHPGVVNDCLGKVQALDPPGVGARSLQECLKLQIQRLGSPDAALLEQIIDHHLKDLERHHYSQIAKKLKIPVEQARLLSQVLHNLEPKPGRPYFQDTAQYITPDVYVYKLADKYVVVLNEDGLPRLQISNFYRRTLMQGGQTDPNAKEYLQNKLRSAMWLIKSIHQRQQTLYKVATSIVKFQHEFLEQGVNGLRPMILRDVAEDIGMHESTVSRVTTNKYLHTPRGIFELKYFFNNSVQSDAGDDVASETVRQRIAQLIQSEDPRKPLSDQTIVSALKKDKIVLARRTVAKYREGLAIPSSSQRRRLE